MPDRLILQPRRAAIRAFRSAGYTLAIAAGVFGIIWTPKTIIGTIGEPLTYWWTALTSLGAAGALVGVLMNRYRIEWISILPSVGGLIACAVAIWGMVSQGELTRIPQASLVTSLAIMFSTRWLELAGHAARLRAEHHREVR